MKKLLIFLSLFAVTGCTIAPLVAPIVTGVLKWSGGEAHKYYDSETEAMYRSTKMALKDLDLVITRDEPTKDGYYIVAGDKNRFKITIKRIAPHITLVSMRVNFMGDKPFAELVYKTIDGKLDIIEFSNGLPIKSNVAIK